MTFADQIGPLHASLFAPVPGASILALLALGVAVAGLLLWVRMRGQVAALRAERDALAQMVDTDDLTDARSRRHMRAIFERETQNGQNALIFIDLDNFKSVNDGYGHKAGDALLRALAEALVGEARENETVFRIGGDEFGVYLRDVDLERATCRAERLREVIAGVSICVDTIRVRRTGSVGVARIERGQDFVGALYYADEAQFAAKCAGGNAVRANSGETLRSMIARRTSPRAEDLAKAISRNEVTYHVQPIFDTRVGCAIGVEALIRWQRPDGRLLLPHQFLDMLTVNYNNADLHPPLEVANGVASAFTGSSEDIFCAFNISSAFLELNLEDDARWADRLLDGLNPRRTVFEIVERAVIRNPVATKRLLSRLRAEGVRVALDDFGTGFSNLERLQEFDVDIVKIDRRFVQGINEPGADLGILRALQEMSQDMNFEIIAEGVESEAELATLQSLGIWNAQGFYLGRPESAEHWSAALGLTQPPPARPTPLRAVR
jgi:diguanylate cyclase (GGDEF)-like protein